MPEYIVFMNSINGSHECFEIVTDRNDNYTMYQSRPDRRVYGRSGVDFVLSIKLDQVGSYLSSAQSAISRLMHSANTLNDLIVKIENLTEKISALQKGKLKLAEIRLEIVEISNDIENTSTIVPRHDHTIFRKVDDGESLTVSEIADMKSFLIGVISTLSDLKLRDEQHAHNLSRMLINWLLEKQSGKESRKVYAALLNALSCVNKRSFDLD